LSFVQHRVVDTYDIGVIGMLPYCGFVVAMDRMVSLDVNAQDMQVKVIFTYFKIGKY